jgi:hypothetical protein
LPDGVLRVNQTSADSHQGVSGLFPSTKAAVNEAWGNAWFWHWQRFIADVSTGAATVGLAFAAFGTTADVLYMQLIPGVLVGIGLMLEPKVTAQPAGDIGPQPVRPPEEPKLARPGSEAMRRFDAAVADAASV